MSDQNLFELMTSDPVKYNSWSLKSKLMLVVGLVIRERNLTQKEVAATLDISQPRVSNLLKGKMDKFSIDSLLEMLFKLGFCGDISFDPRNTDAPLEFKLRKAVL